MSKETMNQTGSGVNMEKAALDAWRVQQYDKLSEETAYILAFLGKVVGGDGTSDLALGTDERLGFKAITHSLAVRHLQAWCGHEYLHGNTLELESEPKPAHNGSMGWTKDFVFPRVIGDTRTAI